MNPFDRVDRRYLVLLGLAERWSRGAFVAVSEDFAGKGEVWRARHDLLCTLRGLAMEEDPDHSMWENLGIADPLEPIDTDLVDRLALGGLVKVWEDLHEREYGQDPIFCKGWSDDAPEWRLVAIVNQCACARLRAVSAADHTLDDRWAEIERESNTWTSIIAEPSIWVAAELFKESANDGQNWYAAFRESADEECSTLFEARSPPLLYEEYAHLVRSEWKRRLDSLETLNRR